ncbi:MAG: iron uptake porin [Coleofasciculaceae cyanobacterium SM2_1_6]|nr:iron uptake porin [Coleofasciculaceae cyanobacterium SM2_1_6]
MSKSLFNLLKVSPAILGASVLMAGGAYAAQSPEAIALQTESTATTEVTNFSVSTVAAPVELAAVPATPETSTTILNLPTAPVTLGSPSVTQTATPSSDIAAETTVDSGDILRQLNRYTAEGEANSQVTSISQLRDVSPRDWAFEALRNLVERYQCIAGYPDGTFQGNRAMTRFEFAAGLNACLRRIEALLPGTGGGQTVTPADLEQIRRLVTEFRTELAALGTRVNSLEGRVSLLEQRQFSTTTKLRGEAVMQLSQTFNGDLNVNTGGRSVTLGSNSNVTFGDRVRLNLNTALSPTALLRTRLQARNLIAFTDQTRTQNTTLNIEGNNGNAFSLSRLLFSDGINIPFVAGARFVVGTVGLDLDDDNLALNFNPTGDAISNFGGNRPIFGIGGGGGAGFRGNVGIFNVALGYTANNPNNPAPGSGLFNGGYAAIGQIAVDSDPFQAAFTYSNTYGNAVDAGFGTFLAADPFGSGESKNTANNYQFDATFRFSPQIALGGFVNYSNVINEVFRFQKADVWSYGLNLAIRDVGTPGSTLGFVFGVPPVARRVQLSGGRTVSNSATPYHAEVFYRFNINDNIDITPGFFAVFRPDGDTNRDTVYVGSVRTTFRF